MTVNDVAVKMQALSMVFLLPSYNLYSLFLERSLSIARGKQESLRTTIHMMAMSDDSPLVRSKALETCSKLSLDCDLFKLSAQNLDNEGFVNDTWSAVINAILEDKSSCVVYQGYEAVNRVYAAKEIFLTSMAENKQDDTFRKLLVYHNAALQELVIPKLPQFLLRASSLRGNSIKSALKAFSYLISDYSLSARKANDFKTTRTAGKQDILCLL